MKPRRVSVVGITVSSIEYTNGGQGLDQTMVVPFPDNFLVAGHLENMRALAFLHSSRHGSEVTQKSTRRPASVHAKRLAGDVTAFRGGKKQHCVGDFGHCPRTVQRDVIQHAFGSLLE